jgi:hypothetical protein
VLAHLLEVPAQPPHQKENSGACCHQGAADHPEVDGRAAKGSVRSFKYRVIVGQRCISSCFAVARARLRVHQLQWAVMHLA